MIGSVSEVTRILNAVHQGDAKAADQLLALVYDELRTLAARKMASEPCDRHATVCNGVRHLCKEKC
jgi:hypothetical protein